MYTECTKECKVKIEMPRKRKPGRPPKKGRKKGTTKKTEAQGFIFDKKMDPKIFWGIVMVILFIGGLLLLLSLFGVAGALGDMIKKGARISFGYMAYFIPFVMFWVGARILNKQRNPESELKIIEMVGLLLIVLAGAGFFHSTHEPLRFLAAAKEGLGGGYAGYIVMFPFEKIVGFWASLVLLLGLLSIGVILASRKTPAELIDVFVQFVDYVRKQIDRITKRKKLESAGLRVKGLSDTSKDEDMFEDDAKDRKPAIQIKGMPSFSGRKSETSEDTAVTVSKPHSTVKPYPLTLLEDKSEKPVSGDIRGNARIIEDTLKNFGIGVKMEEVNIGPTVTQYTFKPNDGVKLSQIVTLQNDLSLALAAHPLRIEAPVPGKSVVGIEIPNKTVALVRLRDVLASKEFKDVDGVLSFALGRDVSGKPAVIDIAKMPHLLIAGATGSGKSVSIHVLLLSLLYKNSPDDLKLILVDPKKVELVAYNDLPHLLTPVITEVEKTINALRWTVAEMERRLKLLSESGKRDIQSYNAAYPDQKLPYLVAVLDELADLMALAANEVEAAVVRLAQMARAVGIHLVLATQRPSVNVITGLIKANMPARIAFTVTSAIDSRTIIDSSGAEKLLGKGDMLFSSSDLGKPRRIQGAFITEQEIKAVVDYLKEQGEPEYNEDVVEKKTATMVPGAGGGMDAMSDEDPLINEARTVVVQAGKASASLLQRRLRVGYARAARLLDSLEEAGIVGPAEGSKPREVFVEMDAGPAGEVVEEESE